MVDSDPIWLGAVLSKHSRDTGIAGVLSVTTEPAVGVGDNYASVIVRAKLKVVLGSGQVTSKKVILKKSLPDLPKEVEADLKNAFNLEGIVYKNILAGYEPLFCEFSLPYEKIWPDCISAIPDVIMFEDLKESGYTLGTRKTGLDPEHAKLVMTNLARLHSLSVIAIAKGSVCPKMLPPFLMVESAIMDSFYNTALSALAGAIRKHWDSDWSQVATKIQNMGGYLIKNLKELAYQENKLSVICHGDCWVNNMMFKYDSKGSPVQHKFLDFQITHYNSYGWDLAYFLGTSLHPKYKEKHCDSLLETYQLEFQENLDRLGGDPTIAPSLGEIKAELARLRPFSLAVSCAILPVTTNPSDVKMSLDEMLKDSEKYGLLFENKEFQETMRMVLTSFRKDGLI